MDMITDGVRLKGMEVCMVSRHRSTKRRRLTKNDKRCWLRCHKIVNVAYGSTKSNFKKLTTSTIPVFVAIIFLNTVHADVGTSMRKGNHLYRQEKYEEALQKYQEALVQEPDNPKIHYNIGRAFYKMEKYDEAISEFEMGLLEKDRAFQSKVFYNVGNCQFRKGQLNAAIESYKMSLLTNHEDMDAKQNLEFCLKLKDQLENQAQSDSTEQQQKQQEAQKPEPQPQPSRGEISPEQAERILQALQSKEKENLEKVKKPEREERVDKDW